MNKVNDTLKSQEKVLAEKEKSLSSSKEVLSEKEQSLSSIKDAISEKDEKLSSAEETLGEMRDELSDTLKDFQEYRVSADSLEKSVDSLKKEKEMKEQKILDLRHSIDSLDSILKDSIEKITELQEKSDLKDKEITSLKTDLSKTEEEINEINKKVLTLLFDMLEIQKYQKFQNQIREVFHSKGFLSDKEHEAISMEIEKMDDYLNKKATRVDEINSENLSMLFDTSKVSFFREIKKEIKAIVDSKGFLSDKELEDITNELERKKENT